MWKTKQRHSGQSLLTHQLPLLTFRAKKPAYTSDPLPPITFMKRSSFVKFVKLLCLEIFLAIQYFFFLKQAKIVNQIVNQTPSILYDL